MTCNSGHILDVFRVYYTLQKVHKTLVLLRLATYYCDGLFWPLTLDSTMWLALANGILADMRQLSGLCGCVSVCSLHVCSCGEGMCVCWLVGSRRKMGRQSRVNSKMRSRASQMVVLLASLAEIILTDSAGWSIEVCRHTGNIHCKPGFEARLVR